MTNVCTLLIYANKHKRNNNCCRSLEVTPCHGCCLFAAWPKEHCKQVPKKVEKQVKAFLFQFHIPS